MKQHTFALWNLITLLCKLDFFSPVSQVIWAIAYPAIIKSTKKGRTSCRIMQDSCLGFTMTVSLENNQWSSVSMAGMKLVYLFPWRIYFRFQKYCILLQKLGDGEDLAFQNYRRWCSSPQVREVACYFPFHTGCQFGWAEIVFPPPTPGRSKCTPWISTSLYVEIYR